MIRIPHLIAAIFLCAPLWAMGATLTRPPEVIESAQADYPPEAQAANVMGDVVLEIDISQTGEVSDARVIQSLGHGLDESALAAAKRLRFSPAEFDGKPAPVRIEYRFHFEMKPTTEPSAAQGIDGQTPGAASAPINLRGKIVERGTKTPLAGAQIDINDGAASAITDANGAFETSVPLGQAKIVVIETSHARFATTENVEEGKITEVTYYLTPTQQGPYETVVVGQKERKDVSTVAITASEIKRVAGVSGDTVKIVQNLPGAARTSFGSGALVLRGGNPNDSKVYIDGMEIPLIWHFGGLTSVYSSELINDVEYEPGNFGVHYGRATAGRIEVKTRDPNSKQFHVLADVNSYQSTLLAEGPISENLSIAIAARRSYIDVVLNRINLFGNDSTMKWSTAPRYYDYQGKVTWTPGKNDTVRLNLFGSDDRLAIIGMSEDTGGIFDSLSSTERFTRASLSWDHKFDANTRSKLLISEGYDLGKFNAGSHANINQDFWTTGLRAELYRDFGKWLTLGAGVDGQYLHYHADVSTPTVNKANGVENPLDDLQGRMNLARLYKMWLPAGWAEAVIRPVDGLALIPGVRIDRSSLVNSTWVDPRFTARWTISENTALKGGAGIYHQTPAYVYLVEKYGNPDIGPEGSRQYSLGVEQKIKGPLTADIQFYYKSLFDMTEPSSRIVVRNGESVTENYDNSGTGKAYGGEVLLRYHGDGRFFGWLSYSYSKTKRDTNNIGGRLGMETNADYDQPHHLTAVGTLEIPEIWNGLSVGFRLQYVSGNPYRKVTGAIFDSDDPTYSDIPSNSYNARLPDFFQLDLRVDKKWTFPLWSLSAYFEIQNATGRKNAQSVKYNYDRTRTAYNEEFPNFPLPSFGLRAEY